MRNLLKIIILLRGFQFIRLIRKIPRKPLIVIFLVLAFVIIGNLKSKAEEHPDFYIDKGACPFECCTYRDWEAEETTELFAEPKTDSRRIGSIENGTVVKALTGEVHSKPGKLIVRKNVDLFQKGEILWVYTYLGEGYYKIWRKGHFIEHEIDFNINEPDNDDWGHFEYTPDSKWWVIMMAPNGLKGWTNHPENFSNKDACG